MSKIITITLNTAIDKIMEVENFYAGGVFKTGNVQTFPAGKGINAARTIAELNEEVVALGFVGKSNRKYYDALATKSYRIDLLEVEEDTRTNLTILDKSNRTETHIREKGYILSDKDYQRFLIKLDEHLIPGDVVIMSGSLPMGIPKNTYELLIEICNLKKAFVILDSSGEELRTGLRAKPHMIKPNLSEFIELTGQKLHTENEIIDAAQSDLLKDIPLIIVSRGPEGVLAFDRNNKQIFKAYIKLEDTSMGNIGVGSGDALVGGLSVGLFTRLSLVKTIRLGVACGVANLFSIGPGVTDINDINRLRECVQVEVFENNQWHKVYDFL